MTRVIRILPIVLVVAAALAPAAQAIQPPRGARSLTVAALPQNGRIQIGSFEAFRIWTVDHQLSRSFDGPWDRLTSTDSSLHFGFRLRLAHEDLWDAACATDLAGGPNTSRIMGCQFSSRSSLDAAWTLRLAERSRGRVTGLFVNETAQTVYQILEIAEQGGDVPPGSFVLGFEGHIIGAVLPGSGRSWVDPAVPESHVSAIAALAGALRLASGIEE